MDTTQHSFLKIHKLSEGISYINMITAYAAALLSICFFVFMDASQSYVLATYLQLPKDDQADAIGDLAFYGEIVILVTTNIWGTISDKFGRRIVYASGFFIVGIGFGLYPLARSFSVLLVFRMIFAFGAAACAAMLSAVLADYVVFIDRGKGSGLLGLSAGGGAVLGALVLLQIPAWLQSVGLQNIDAGYVTYFCVAFIAMLSSIGVFLGLNKHTKSVDIQAHNSILSITKEGVIAGKNPIMALAYASGFAARGDSAVATTFLSFWVFQAAHTAGMGDSAALSRAGVVDGVAQTCGLVFAPIAGILCYKIHRVIAMAILSALAAFGYILICFTDDPLGAWMMIGACLVGCGEIGLVVSSTALVAQEAPPDIRGAASGFFSFCGSIGIILATKVGSILAKKNYAAPFLLFGCFNLLLFILSLLTYVWTKFHPPTTNYRTEDEYAIIKHSPSINDGEKY